jgi:hypothetical protein
MRTVYFRDLITSTLARLVVGHLQSSSGLSTGKRFQNPLSKIGGPQSCYGRDSEKQIPAPAGNRTGVTGSLANLSYTTHIMHYKKRVRKALLRFAFYVGTYPIQYCRNTLHWPVPQTVPSSSAVGQQLQRHADKPRVVTAAACSPASTPSSTEHGLSSETISCSSGDKLYSHYFAVFTRDDNRLYSDQL